MTVSFDTLSCAKRLSEAGEPPQVAEAHAMVLKDFATATLPGKADIRHLHEEIENMREEIEDLRCELKDACCELREFRQEVSARCATKADLGDLGEIGQLRIGLEATMQSTMHEMAQGMAQMLTVRFGVIAALAIGAAAMLERVI
jgi:hypothetical protein